MAMYTITLDNLLFVDTPMKHLVIRCAGASWAGFKVQWYLCLSDVSSNHLISLKQPSSVTSPKSEIKALNELV